MLTYISRRAHVNPHVGLRFANPTYGAYFAFVGRVRYAVHIVSRHTHVQSRVGLHPHSMRANPTYNCRIIPTKTLPE